MVSSELIITLSPLWILWTGQLPQTEEDFIFRKILSAHKDTKRNREGTVYIIRSTHIVSCHNKARGGAVCHPQATVLFSWECNLIFLHNVYHLLVFHPSSKSVSYCFKSMLQRSRCKKLQRNCCINPIAIIKGGLKESCYDRHSCFVHWLLAYSSEAWILTLLKGLREQQIMETEKNNFPVTNELCSIPLRSVY